MISTRLVSPTASAFNSPLLIKSILEQSNHYEPEREILYRDQVRMDYKTLHKRIAKLAHTLENLGVKPGDVVGVMEFDSHRFLELYFAVPMIGAILHTINFRLSPEQMVYTMNHAEDKIIFCNQEFLPLLNKTYKNLDTVEKYVVLQDEDKETKTEFDLEDEYEDLIGQEENTYDFPDFDERTMATLFYTTGTTGYPKGVCFSHRQLVLHTMAVSATISGIESAININNSDVYMPMTPMFHVHAWGIPYVATMLGQKQVYPGRYEPDMLKKLILTEKVSFSHCVPTILGMLLNAEGVEDIDLSPFKILIGGSALPEGLARKAFKMGIDISTGYGLSETCPVLTIPYISKSKQEELSDDKEIKERIKTGRPVLFVEMELMDDDGRFLPKDGETIGKIVVRAPWLTQRYYKEERRSEELWKGGYLHTGDMAYIEPNGTAVIVDRKKMSLNLGENGFLL